MNKRIEAAMKAREEMARLKAQQQEISKKLNALRAVAVYMPDGVDHPDFEVHNTVSLGKALGCHATLIKSLIADGRLIPLALRIHPAARHLNKISIAISKSEIERVKNSFDNKNP